MVIIHSFTEVQCWTIELAVNTGSSDLSIVFIDVLSAFRMARTTLVDDWCNIVHVGAIS